MDREIDTGLVLQYVAAVWQQSSWTLATSKTSMQWAQLPLSLPRRRPFVISDKSFIVAEKPSSVSRARFAGSGEWWKTAGRASCLRGHRYRRGAIGDGVKLTENAGDAWLRVYDLCIFLWENFSCWWWEAQSHRSFTLKLCQLLIINVFSSTKQDKISQKYFDRSLHQSLALRNSVRWDDIRFPR